MKSCIAVYSLLVIFIIFCPGGIALGQELPEDYYKVIFQIDARNNLSALDHFYPSVKKEKICLIDEIPESITAGLNINLQMPCLIRHNIEYGLSIKQKNWYRMTGETVEFYQDVMKNEPVLYWKYYDLGYDEEIYQRLGIYVLKKEPINKGEIIFRGDLFLVPEYRKTEIIGQGRVFTDIYGMEQAELNGNYKKSSIREIGWGGGLSFETNYRWDSGIQLGLALNNLLSIVYFPGYVQENGIVDSSENVLSPVYMSGFRKEEIVWSNLPLELIGKFYYPVANGRFGLHIIKTGEFSDFYIEYLHSINSRDSGLLIRADPVMVSLELGYLWHNGKFVFSFSPLCDWRITGLGISLLY